MRRGQPLGWFAQKTGPVFRAVRQPLFWLPLLPLLIGLGGYLLLHTRFRPVPVLVFKADVGSALLVTGGLLTLLLGAFCGAWAMAANRGERRRQADLAAARQTEEESRRRFIRQLDHELKNPLTGLRAALANLGGVIEGGDGLALADANRQSSRLSRLVADLRKLAELEERPLEPEVVDVGELLAETVDAVLALPQYSGRTVTCVIPRVPWPLPPVTGDRDLLGLVFYNLLENALKYSKPRDEVEVRAAEDGPWINIEVADSGPGIAATDLPRVFEELYRGANARGLEGAGLGLALAQRVITRHAGEIEVRSRQAGSKGTVFRVRLKK